MKILIFSYLVLFCTASVYGLHTPYTGPVIDPATLGYTELVNSVLRYEDYTTPDEDNEDQKLTKQYGDIQDYQLPKALGNEVRLAKQLRAQLLKSEGFASPNAQLARQSVLNILDLRILDFEEAAENAELPIHLTLFNTTSVTHNINIPSDARSGYVKFVFAPGTKFQVLALLQDNRNRAIAKYLEPAEIQEIIAVTRRLTLLTEVSDANEREKVRKEWQLTTTSWDNYNHSGYSQFPWENFVNGWFLGRWQNISPTNPPRWQAVVVHPEPIVILDAGTGDSGDVGVGISVHGLGLIRYFGEERSSYAGLSGSFTFNDTSDELLIGPTIHYGSTKNSILPDLTLGVSYETNDGKYSGPFFIFGVDFWKWINEDKSRGSGLIRNTLGFDK